MKADKIFKVAYDDEFNKYKQNINIQKIINFKKAPFKLLKKDKLEDILRFYYEKDNVISLSEKVVDELYLDWDRRVQMEIDRRRGK